MTAKKSKTQEVAPVEEKKSLITAAPTMGAGFENVSKEDLVLPRLMLLHALSPQVQEKGMKPGQFFHNVLEEELGDRLNIVPIMYQKQWILWNPREAGGGILNRASDGIHWDTPNQTYEIPVKGQPKPIKTEVRNTVDDSPACQWGSSIPGDPKSAPIATLHMNFLVLIEDKIEYGPMVLSLARSQIEGAKKFLNKMAGVSRFQPIKKNMFHQRHLLLSFDDKNRAGQPFKNMRFDSNGLLSEDDAAYMAAKEFFKMYNDKIIDVKDLQDDNPEPIADDNDDERY